MRSSTRMQSIDRNDIADVAHWNDQPITSVYQSIVLGRPAEELTVRLHSAARDVRHLVMERFGMGTAEAMSYSDRLREVDAEQLLGIPGVAFFLSPERAVEVRLDAAPGELVQVGSSPNLLPLVPWLADRSRWWVLSLSQTHVRLFRADRKGLTPIDVPNLPQSFKDSNWFVRRERGLSRAQSGVLHGTGGDRDLHKSDLRRHFRAVDKALKPVLKHSHEPLVIAAVEYEASMFSDATRYRRGRHVPLIANPDHFDTRTLHRLSHEVLSRAGVNGVADALARLHAAQNKGWVASYPNRVQAALAEGRVGELLIAESLTDVDGIRRHHEDAMDVGPAVLAALRAHLAVTVVPAEELPKGSLMAALLRY